jgi:hypothetical protein
MLTGKPHTFRSRNSSLKAEIAEREGLQPQMQGGNLDVWAAAIAVSRYDEAHRRWSEENADEKMRTLRIQAQENVRMLKVGVEPKKTSTSQSASTAK